MNKRNFIIVTMCFAISIISSIISNDIIIGGTTLLSGLLCAYFASIGKRINYIFGLINYLLMGYVAFKNNLYGIFLFYILIFSPMQIGGFISWNKNLDKNSNVKIREFTLKNSVIIIISCIIGSFVLGYLLSLIPRERLAFFDASSNIINLCGVVLLMMRYKEAWWIWLTNNIIDLIIWIITTINNGENSIMMLLTSVGYLLINIYGIINWQREIKRKKEIK